MPNARALSFACSIATWLAACSDDAQRGDGADGDQDSGAGNGSGAVGLDACFADLAAPDASFVEVQSFASEDGAVAIRRARKPGARSSVGETFPYDLVRFGIESEGEVHCATRASRLSYEFGHHNWNEHWEAQSGQARYAVTEALDVVRLGDEPDATDLWTDTLEVLAPSGDAALTAARPLVQAGCYSLPYDANPCFKRMRTDMPPAGGQE